MVEAGGVAVLMGNVDVLIEVVDVGEETEVRAAVVVESAVVVVVVVVAVVVGQSVATEQEQFTRVDAAQSRHVLPKALQK